MSTAGTDSYRSWDAAYVLGALNPAERHEFEEHLAECGGCRAAVAELAGLPSLLAALTPAEAQALAPTGPEAAQAGLPSAGLPLGLVDNIRMRRRRARLAVAAVVIAASAASGVITAVVTSPGPPAVQAQPASATALHFTPLIDSGLTATGSMTGQPWGTRIDWECTYSPSSGDYPSGSGDPQSPEEYSLVVIDSKGVATQLASWTGTPGTVATPAATTTIRAADIRRVEIRAAGSGRTVLSAVL